MELLWDSIEDCRYVNPKYEICRDPDWWKKEIDYPGSPEVGAGGGEVEPPPEKEFNRLAKQWREETAGFSVTAQKYAHPAYHAILVLAAENLPEVLPLILEELRARPGRWFEALKLLTKEDPTKPADSFDDAVRAWIAWGIRKKHIR